MTQAKTAMDVLVLAAHPDDAEFACAGIILKLVAAGRRVAIVDLTMGEMGTNGDAASRQQECQAASKLLAVAERRNLALADAHLRDDEACLLPLVQVLRELRPQMLLAPASQDLHPDHVATHHLARRAFFLSGLAKFQPKLGAPCRPRLCAYYPGNSPIQPSLCVDISAQLARKQQVIQCYQSQVGLKDASHLAGKMDHLQRVAARDRFYGSMMGWQAAEPLLLDGPVPVQDLLSLLDSTSEDA